MVLQNAFEVDAPIERVWAALTDIPRLAMSVPYTEQVTVIDWDFYEVRIALRFGLVTIRYDGELQLRSRNDETRTLVVHLAGKQSSGSGGVRGLITLHATPRGHGTHVAVHTDAELSGLITSFGTAVIESVARRTIAEFARRFRKKL